METLRDLFLDELADVLSAEKQLLKAMPAFGKNATNAELKTAFEEHLEETQEHVKRVEEVFSLFGKPAKAKKCEAMAGLLEEGKSILEEGEPGPVLDAALICAAQKVEHYEIATYGCLCTWAEQLEEEEALNLLKETMEDEEAADERLSEIAESVVNQEAHTADKEDE